MGEETAGKTVERAVCYPASPAGHSYMSDRYFYTARRSHLFVQSFTASTGTGPGSLVGDVAGSEERDADGHSEDGVIKARVASTPWGSRPSFVLNSFPSDALSWTDVGPTFDPNVFHG